MIRTSFRIQVETGAIDDDVLTPFSLAQVFKCAPAQHAALEDEGLPSAGPYSLAALEGGKEEAAGEAVARGEGAVCESKAEGAAVDGADTGGEDAACARDVAAAAAKQAATILTAHGKAIPRAAYDTYRETMAMRTAFGIAKEKRTHVDTAHGTLARILAEPLVRAADPAHPARPLPKTQRAQAEEALAGFPHVLPALGLRISILHRPLWEADDPVARQNWKKVVVPQVAERAIELQRDLLRLEAPGDLDERVVQALRFNRTELRFDRFVVSVANPQVNRLPNVSDAMQAVYERLNDGSLGEGKIARIDIPWVDYDAVAQQATLRLQALRAAKAAGEQAVGAEDAEKAAAALTPVAGEGTVTDAALSDGECGTAKADDAPLAGAGEGGDALAGADSTGASDAQSEADDSPACANAADEEPPSRTQGVSALRFQEETITAVRAAEQALFAPQPAAEDSEVQPAASDPAHSVWGVIGMDGTLRYFDAQAGAFCDKPLPEDDANAGEHADNNEASSAEQDNPAHREPCDSAASLSPASLPDAQDAGAPTAKAS